MNRMNIPAPIRMKNVPIRMMNSFHIAKPFSVGAAVSPLHFVSVAITICLTEEDGEGQGVGPILIQSVKSAKSVDENRCGTSKKPLLVRREGAFQPYLRRAVFFAAAFFTVFLAAAFFLAALPLVAGFTSVRICSCMYSCT